MRVLVTGATGFVGSHLLPALQARGDEVRPTVRRPRGLTADEVVTGDIATFAHWKDAVAGCDAVVHLAAKVHEDGSDSGFTAVNAVASGRLAAAAAAAGVRRLVYVSTIAIHARSETVIDEGSPVAPQTAYGRSKVAAEQAIHASGVATTVLRPPLVYGPDGPGNFVRLVDLVARRAPLPFASVDNQRSFIYVANLVSAIQSCLEDERALGATFVVADAETLSTPSLIRTIGQALDVHPRLWPMPPWLARAAMAAIGHGTDASRLLDSRVVDATAIADRLGWAPPHEAVESIRLTVERTHRDPP